MARQKEQAPGGPKQEAQQDSIDWGAVLSGRRAIGWYKMAVGLTGLGVASSLLDNQFEMQQPEVWEAVARTSGAFVGNLVGASVTLSGLFDALTGKRHTIFPSLFVEKPKKIKNKKK